MFHSQLPAVDAAAVPAEAIVLDVRENEEWAAGHAEGAVHHTKEEADEAEESGKDEPPH